MYHHAWPCVCVWLGLELRASHVLGYIPSQALLLFVSKRPKKTPGVPTFCPPWACEGPVLSPLTHLPRLQVRFTGVAWLLSPRLCFPRGRGVKYHFTLPFYNRTLQLSCVFQQVNLGPLPGGRSLLSRGLDVLGPRALRSPPLVATPASLAAVASV
jgi:hypothetical protein